MKKSLLYITFIFLGFQISFAQVWETSITPQNGYINEISVVNDHVIWIKDPIEANGFSISVDGGISWEHKNFPTLFINNNFNTGILNAVDENTAYIIVSGSDMQSLVGLYKTIDAGNTWERESAIFNSALISFPSIGPE